MPLPRSALLALWLNGVVGGTVGPDDFAAAVRSDDPQHLVLGWPETPEPMTLEQLPAAVRRIGAVQATLSLPAPGSPFGLAGPASFNAAALDLGEAVVFLGPRPVGLLPEVDARTIVWMAVTAEPPALLDPYEEGRQLRQTLLTATSELVRLDVASWQPEIPDLLLNLSHRDPLRLPPGLPVRAIEAIERAELCLEIVTLARVDDGGAVTSHEALTRRSLLQDLDAAARRTLVAFCSANLITS